MSDAAKPRMGRPKLAKPVTCEQCKKVFDPIGTRPRKFCGFECRDKSKRAQRVNEQDGTARCARCKEWKSIDDFVKGRFGRPHSYCKQCSSDWFAERRGTDPEKRKPYRAAYRLTEEQKRENKRALNHMQHQARRAAGPKPCKYEIMRMVCEQDGKCAYCQCMLVKGYHIDHKIPVSRGGKNDIENLHLTCPRCNISKGSMTHEEFLVSKRRRATSW